jgi:hypothetical protein
VEGLRVPLGVIIGLDVSKSWLECVVVWRWLVPARITCPASRMVDLADVSGA